MPSDMEYLYWDSCVFLSYINGDPDRITIIDSLLSEIQGNDHKKILTSGIAKVEVAHAACEKIHRSLDPEIERKIDLLWADSSVVEIVELHDQISSSARALIRDGILRGWCLSPNDAIHLASAKWMTVKEIHTYDEGMMKYSSLVGIKICHPHLLQPRLIP